MTTIERTDRQQFVDEGTAFLNQMYALSRDLADGSPWGPMVHLDSKVRRRQMFEAGKAIKEVEKLLSNVRYDSRIALPEDSRGFFRDLRDRVAQAGSANPAA